MKTTNHRMGENWIMRLVLILVAAASTCWVTEGAVGTPAAILPVAAPIRIDGKSSDWERNTATHPIMTAAGLAGRFRLASDDDNLYALIEVTDASPLKNNATPIEELFKRGDAIGICADMTGSGTSARRFFLTSADGRPVVLAQIPSSVEKHPYRYAITAERGITLDYVSMVPTAEAAFALTDNGYLAEVRLPWKILGGRPTGDAAFPFDVQLVFSDSGGMANTAVAWWHSDGPEPNTVTDLLLEAQIHPQYWGQARITDADPGPQPALRRFQQSDPEVFTGPGSPIAFTLPQAANVTLVVRNKSGWIVRELLRARALTAGAYTAYWNGRDRWGDPCPAGTYTYTLATFDGMKASFTGSAGNDGHPVYRTANGLGSIGGVHGGPWAVAADASGVYAFNSWQEGPPPYRKITPDGDPFWTAEYQHVPQALATPATEDALYLVYGDANQPAVLLCLDPRSGRPMPVPGSEQPWSQVVLGKAPVEGLAILNNRAFYSVPIPEEAPAPTLNAQTLENPLDDTTAAILNELNESKVVVGYVGVLNLRTGKPEATIPVPHPLGLAALDDTQLLVCTENQVLALTVTEGVQQRVFATGLEAPRAIAVDRERGWVYVSELGTSQQIRKYDRNGTLLATFGKPGGRPNTVLSYDPLQFRNIMGLAIGAGHELWAVERWVAPRRFIRLTSDGDWVADVRGPAHWHTTLFADTDDPAAMRHFIGNQLVSSRMDLTAYATNGGMPAWKIEGIYELGAGANTPGVPFSLMGDMEYSMNAGICFIGENGRRYLFLDSRWHNKHAVLFIWEEQRWKPVAAISNGGRSQTWSDANGNGRVEADELSAAPQPTWGWVWMDRNLTLHGVGGYLRPAGLDPNGVPDYRKGVYEELAPGGETIDDWVGMLSRYDIVFPSQIDSDGAQYFAANLGPGAGRYVWDRAAENRLVKMRGGAVEWMVGSHAENALFQHIAGVVDGVVLFPDVHASFIGYTTDGLALGKIMGGSFGPEGLYVELFNGLFYKDRNSGKRMLTSSSNEDARQVEISGVFDNDISRIQGTLPLAAAQPLATETSRNYALRYQTWSRFASGNSIADGYDWDWAPGTDIAAMRDEQGLAGEVRLRRDAGQLCLFATVLDAAPLPERTDASGPAYGTAPGVEILLGPGDPSRTAPTQGDTRIFLTVGQVKGQPVGQAYLVRPASTPLPVNPELRGLGARGDYEGNLLTRPLDCRREWVPIPGAVVGVHRRFDGAGYRVEAELPLAALPELVVARRVHIVRYHSSIDRTEIRTDLSEDACRLNFAIHTRDRAGTVRRVAWIPDGQSSFDPLAMNPSAWGWANAGVRLDWTPVQDAQEYRLYRAPADLAASLVAAISNATGTTAMDLPGTGTFEYWLAPVYADGEGQWIGPVRARDARAAFPLCVSTPALRAAALRNLVVDAAQVSVVNVRLPGATAVTVATGKGITVTAEPRGNDVWSLVIETPDTTTVGAHFALSLTVARGKATETLPVSITTRLTPLRALVPATAKKNVPPELPDADLALGPDLDESFLDIASLFEESAYQWNVKKADGDTLDAQTVPGQPWPVAYLTGQNVTAEYSFLAANGATAWQLEGRVKFARMYNGGQPASITLLDAKHRPIASLLHARGEGPWAGHRQYLALNGRAFYSSEANIDPLRGEWQPFVIRIAAGKATLSFGIGYEIEAPISADADWRKPASVRLAIVTAGLWVSDLRLSGE